jgi:hypothetical protein
MGDILMKNREEKVAWKERMLKAGLGNQGLEFPEEWSGLSTATKEARLNQVLGVLESKPKKSKKKGVPDWIAKETDVF